VTAFRRCRKGVEARSFVAKCAPQDDNARQGPQNFGGRSSALQRQQQIPHTAGRRPVRNDNRDESRRTSEGEALRYKNGKRVLTSSVCNLRGAADLIALRATGAALRASG